MHVDVVIQDLLDALRQQLGAGEVSQGTLVLVHSEDATQRTGVGFGDEAALLSHLLPQLQNPFGGSSSCCPSLAKLSKYLLHASNGRKPISEEANLQLLLRDQVPQNAKALFIIIPEPLNVFSESRTKRSAALCSKAFPSMSKPPDPVAP